MEILKIDETWSIEYDPDDNDRPAKWLHYGICVAPFDENKAVACLFYALLVRSNELHQARKDLSKARNEASRLRWPDTTGGQWL